MNGQSFLDQRRSYHARNETIGYLAMLIAGRMVDALQKRGARLSEPHEVLVGVIRHDTPVDLLAGVLMDLADTARSCACKPDEDGDLYCSCGPDPGRRAAALIEKFQGGPQAVKPEDWNNGRDAPARLY